MITYEKINLLPIEVACSLDAQAKSLVVSKTIEIDLNILAIDAEI